MLSLSFVLVTRRCLSTDSAAVRSDVNAVLKLQPDVDCIKNETSRCVTEGALWECQWGSVLGACVCKLQCEVFMW